MSGRPNIVSRIKLFLNGQSHPAYLKSLDFARTYNPKSGRDYSWVIKHAEQEYSRLENISDVLDSKADTLVKYVGVVLTAISLAVSLDFINKEAITKSHAIPVLAMMTASILIAVVARKPGSHAMPLTTEKAFKYADFFDKDVAEASSAAMTTAASILVQIQNERKGKLIKASLFLFVVAVVWLAVAPFVLNVSGV